MNETTAAKLSAAYGSRRRLATGVTNTPTKRQARNAAEAAVAPSEIANHRRPWATIPTTNRDREMAPPHRVEAAIRRHGKACRDDVQRQPDPPRWQRDRERRAAGREAEQEPCGDCGGDEKRKRDPRSADRHARPYELECFFTVRKLLLPEQEV